MKAGKETNIHLMVDILKVFNGTINLSIAANPMVMFSDYSTVIANNLFNNVQARSYRKLRCMHQNYIVGLLLFTAGIYFMPVIKRWQATLASFLLLNSL